ncbi:hypothetical protein H4S07_001743 [Coemansia furcata]|uniref:Uncharacterized protein n=1 Tax=Coemansia furcata TaxID=417177 RepID=A0ACC1LNE5_9FUNG|nr:hypothetical protein H4S07_001743 [Coemansia furcata]
MFDYRMPYSDPAFSGISLLGSMRKYSNRCRVQLVTATPNVSTGDSTHDENIRTLLEAHCPSLTDAKQACMKPTPFLRGGMLQSLYSTMRALKRDKYSDISYDRETKILSDGGTVSLDWYPARGTDSADARPVAIVMSGVGGSSYEYHIRCLSKTLGKDGAGYRVVVMNHRGMARTPLTSPKIYNASDTSDFCDIVKYIGTCCPNAPLLGVGFSLGANVLTKYLGEQGADSPLTAAVVICCPFDMSLTGRSLDADTFLNNNLYQPHLVATIKRFFQRNSEILQNSPTNYDWDAIMKATRMSQIDTLVTARDYGQRDCWEHYRAASSTPYVDGIRTPYLAINAMDDPVTRFEGIPQAKFRNNPHIALALLKHGGHLGFFCGLRPKIWYLTPLTEFFDAVLKHKSKAPQLTLAL